MLRITQIKIPVRDDEKGIENRICKILKIKKDALIDWKIVRRSIEARRREELSYVYTVYVRVKGESALLKKSSDSRVSLAREARYAFPACGNVKMDGRPVIVGSGPAGLFCAYFLALHGYAPIVFERGEAAEERARSVARFWETGILNTESNVQFGEGGAGMFSDGKLNTGISDKYGRNSAVLEILVKHGAQKEILYDAKPHVGTDVLQKVIVNMRKEIEAHGGEFFFGSRVDDIEIQGGAVRAIRAKGKTVDTGICVLAIGHSARDTFRMIYEKNAKILPKPFAVGVRVQHAQEDINKIQWGEGAPKKLGAAPYKLSAALPNGRNVYTFCMCPGGYVVNASSEEGALAVNGMSYSGRASGYANGAVIVSVGCEDYLRYADENIPSEISAVAFQRELERKAFNLADGKIPVQTFKDFRRGTYGNPSDLIPCTKGSWAYADTKSIFPDFISESLILGMERFGKKLEGFDGDNTLILGVESRTSSPIRIVRDESFQSNIAGLYPCGEGAGYAGGIMSAAIDGIRIAEAIAAWYRRSGL